VSGFTLHIHGVPLTGPAPRSMPESTAMTDDSAQGQPTDAALVAAIARRDEAAFAEFYDRHSGLAWAIVRRLLSEEEAAREVVQDAFVSIWRDAAGFGPERARPTTWLVHVCRMRAIDRLRRDGTERRGGNARHTAIEGALDVASPHSTADSVEAADAARRIRDALDSLPESHRALVLLAFYDGYSHSEIASALDLPTGTVKSRLSRALDQLRAAFDHPAHEVRP
jgi:RNA polymerase sigma-70 factor (ECF subfamily)